MTSFDLCRKRWAASDVWDTGAGGVNCGAGGAGLSVLCHLFPVLQTVPATGDMYGPLESDGWRDAALHAAGADHRHSEGDDHGVLGVRIGYVCLWSFGLP